MKTLITEFISLDGVVQAPGGPKEDTDGGFAHGGWSMKYFDPDVMYGTYTELARQSDALMQGRRTYQISAAAWPRRSGDATMVRSLLEADLVDELLLTIEPIILGGGKTIFAAHGKTMPFTLASTARASTGAQVCRYVRAR